MKDYLIPCALFGIAGVILGAAVALIYRKDENRRLMSRLEIALVEKRYETKAPWVEGGRR